MEKTDNNIEDKFIEAAVENDENDSDDIQSWKKMDDVLNDIINRSSLQKSGLLKILEKYNKSLKE